FTQSVNESVAAGRATLLFELDALGHGADQNPVTGRMYDGADLGHTPLFDGTDVWPIDPASLASFQSLATARAQFPQGYLTGQTWVGRAAGDLVVPLVLSSFNPPTTFPLTIRHAIVTMTLNPSRTSVTNGTIAGIIPTEVLVETIKQLEYQTDSSL